MPVGWRSKDKLTKTNLDLAHSASSDQEGVVKEAAAEDSGISSMQR